MQIRRVVTTHDANGRSSVGSDGLVPRAVTFDTVPGFHVRMVWADEGETAGAVAAEDRTADVSSWLPPQRGSRLLVVTFPPDAAPDAAEPEALAQEFATKLPGLAETFEKDDPGMHRTETLDYGVVLDGELWLELDGGKQVHLKQHDIVVQTGTRHAWRNRGDKPATILFVLISKAP